MKNPNNHHHRIHGSIPVETLETILQADAKRRSALIPDKAAETAKHQEAEEKLRRITENWGLSKPSAKLLLRNPWLFPYLRAAQTAGGRVMDVRRQNKNGFDLCFEIVIGQERPEKTRKILGLSVKPGSLFRLTLFPEAKDCAALHKAVRRNLADYLVQSLSHPSRPLANKRLQQERLLRFTPPQRS